jgi:hypothetical protein
MKLRLVEKDILYREDGLIFRNLAHPFCTCFKKGDSLLKHN